MRMDNEDSLKKFGTVLCSYACMMSFCRFNGKELDLGPWLELFGFVNEEHANTFQTILGWVTREFLKENHGARTTDELKSRFVYAFWNWHALHPHRFDSTKFILFKAREPK